MSIIRPAPDRRKPWRAPDRCKIMWATAAALQSPYPLACSVLIADKYQDRAFDWHFRRIRRHLRKALGQQPAVLVVQHNRPQPHVHLSLAAYSESEVPLIGDALRDAVGDWGSSRGEVYQVEIRPLYSVGLDPDIETLIGGKPKPNTPGWGRYMINGARTSGSITYAMTNVMRAPAQLMHRVLGLHKSKSTTSGTHIVDVQETLMAQALHTRSEKTFRKDALQLVQPTKTAPKHEHSHTHN